MIKIFRLQLEIPQSCIIVQYSEVKHIPTTSVRKCADTRKLPCKYLADLRDVFLKKKSELYKPPLRLYTTFQKY
ncbi:hypothetical protein OUZ56_014266 [Daphnia magna]|uniref:Uncharacterized protein n=1 Tax=Daphnia magna TaxID=35525 RepID=A0ABR0AJ96_9CRUS|nr:hypothetical protein OUZ56_014266 [Daphnia magna]